MKIEQLLQDCLSFLKNNLKFCIVLEGSYKSRDGPDELYNLFETYIKKLKTGLDAEGLLEMTLKFLKFLENID